MSWALTLVLLMLVVYKSFPVKGEDCSVMVEEKYFVSVSFFWGPNSVLNFAPLKPDFCLLSVLPPPLVFPASQYSNNWEYSTNTILDCITLNGSPRGKRFSPLFCPYRGWVPPVGLLGTSAILHFWFPIFSKAFEGCTAPWAQLLWTPVWFPQWGKGGAWWA